MEETRRVLYGVPNQEQISNVLDGFSKNLSDQLSVGQFLAGTSRERNISADDLTLGANPRIMLGVLGALRLDVATVRNLSGFCRGSTAFAGEL